VALGCYLTTNAPPIFKELVDNIAVSTMSGVLGRKDHSTDAYVAPALPFGLAANHDWCVLGCPSMLRVKRRATSSRGLR
jgi:hypothetical protein